jgi:hypothetical protein
MKQKLDTPYFHRFFHLIPIFLSCIVLIGLLLRDLQYPDSLTEDEKKINLYTQIVLSFISSSVIFMFAFYILRPPFHLWISIVTLLFLLFTPFALVILRLFVTKENIRSINILILLSVLFVMLYTFKAAGG